MSKRVGTGANLGFNSVRPTVGDPGARLSGSLRLGRHKLSPARGQGNGPRGAGMVLRVNETPETGMLLSGPLSKPVQGQGHSWDLGGKKPHQPSLLGGEAWIKCAFPAPACAAHASAP